MQISIEESGAIERKLTISVPRAEVDLEISKRLRKVAGRARIPGFRPGKAPQNIIEQRYGEQVTNEVVSDTIQSSYREALGKKEIVPAALLSIEPKPFVAGDDLQYVATIELFPQIPSPTLTGRDIEKPVCEVAAEDVERTLEDIRKRHADFVPRVAVAVAGGGADSGGAEQGDRLTVDCQIRPPLSGADGGALKDHQFILGEGQFLSFDDELQGLLAGARKTIAHTFPADHPGEEVAGKTLDFDVTVKTVERPVLPELDAAFAEKLGIAEGGMAKMREEIEVSLRRELADRMRMALRERVMEALLAANEIEAPKALVESEIDRRVQALGEQMTAQGAPRQEIEEIRRLPFADAARRSVILGLITHEIIHQAKLKPDAKIVRARVEEMATSYDEGEAMVKWYYEDPTRLRQIEAVVLEEMVVERMLETANVSEKQVSFQEFMNPQPQQ